MQPLYIESKAASGNRGGEKIPPWTEIPALLFRRNGLDIKDCRTGGIHLITLANSPVPNHRKGSQIDFRSRYGRPEIHHDPMVEPGQALGVDQKIVVGTDAHRGTVGIGMLVDDVVPDADMDRAGNAQMIPHRQNAFLPVGEVVFPDVFADRFAPAEILGGTGADGVIHQAAFLP